ncbi:TIR domain-containing protein [Paractinoplanes deccanensis]|uniref:TIR domain-containing protein n=1 Tax=Paractinoplanes deccanensis TaxID=113561 RepID=UPI00194560B1|nr:nucleotide-binding protein [Actinoplanes deccanensis]
MATGSISALSDWLMREGALAEGSRTFDSESPFEGSAVRRHPAGARHEYRPDQSRLRDMQSAARPNGTVFLVHSHDGEAQHGVARFVARFVARLTGQQPVILGEQANRGRTVLEKFEHSAAEAGYAIVLATPDDIGRAKSHGREEERLRARQNVVFELGFFFGRLGRGHVAVLNAGVEKPSDIEGIAYLNYPDGNWKVELAKEMHAAGITVDMSRLLD